MLFLGILGLLIFVLAITNYTTSAIFNTIERMREVGIRKLLGMKPHHLVFSFVTEALVIHFIAGLLALALFYFLTAHGLSFFAEKAVGSENPLDLQAISRVNFLAIILFTLLLFLSSTLLSSLYPAFYFNQLRPVHLLMGKLQLLHSKLLAGANSVTQVLLTFQLTSAIIFFSGILIIHAQLRFLNQQEITPFDLQVSGIFPGLAGANDTFKKMADLRIDEMRRGNGETLREISFSNLRHNELHSTGLIHFERGDHQAEKHVSKLFVIDYSYWKEDRPFVAGGNFSENFGSDPNHIILNRKAAELLGNAEGVFIGDRLSTDMGVFSLLGIVDDQAGEPIAYVTGFGYRTFINLTLHYEGGRSIADFLTSFEVNLSSAFPFITLLKRDFQKEKQIEQRIAQIFILFTILALSIASFGLFSLSSFIAEKRAKEMDIRKLLGASRLKLIQIMSTDMLLLVVFASIIAGPLVYFVARLWLDQYPKSMDFDPTYIALPALTVLLFSSIIALPKCWKRANSNLAKSLGRS